MLRALMLRALARVRGKVLLPGVPHVWFLPLLYADPLSLVLFHTILRVYLGSLYVGVFLCSYLHTYLVVLSPPETILWC